MVSADGRHTVRVTVADQAGNEVDQSVEVAIDRLAPSTSAVVDQDARTVTLAASDATSGVVAVEYSVDSQSAWQPYTDPVVVDAYKHDVFYRATDAAGNRSAVATVTVPISPDAPMVGNIAPFATPTASYTASWNNVNALNDGRGTNSGGSQGLLWGSWTGNEPVNRWIQYTWGAPVTVDSSEVMFWTDAGVAVPQSWYIEHWEAEAQAWVQVTNPSGYGTARTGTNVTTFDPVTTTRLRATLFTYPNAAGTSRSAVAVSEWEVVADEVGEEPDTMAPTVGLATDPAGPGSGWFTGEVTVTATAEDDVDADPVVELRLGDGPWQPYAGPHVLSVDGRHVVAARATDASGNVSDEVELEAAIDTATPTTSAVLDPSARQATFASSDAGSGVARVEAHLGDEVWASVAGPLALPDDAVTVHFRAVDVAGNVETARHLEVAAAEPVPVFADVTEAHRSYTEIRWLAGARLVTGKVAGDRMLFQPSKATSREALAELLYRYAGAGAMPAEGTQTFTDVGLDHPSYAAVEWVAAQALLDLEPSGAFRLGKAASREDGALALYRLAGSPVVQEPLAFNDVPAGTELALAASWAVQEGIAAPQHNGRFGAEQALSREVMAGFLYRYHHR